MRQNTKNAADATTKPRERMEAVYLTLTVPRCPECESTRWRAYKSRRDDDGGGVRYSRCSKCGFRAVIVVEIGDE